MHQNIDADHQLRGSFTHQYIISSNIGFALGTIDNQRFDRLISFRYQLKCSWKTRAT